MAPKTPVREALEKKKSSLRPGEREDLRRPPSRRRESPQRQGNAPGRERSYRPGEREERRPRKERPKSPDYGMSREGYRVQERSRPPSQGQIKTDDWRVTDDLNRLKGDKSRQESRVKSRADDIERQREKRIIYRDGERKGQPLPDRDFRPGYAERQRPPGLYPPESTGPVVGPPGMMRARYAPMYNLSDPARRAAPHAPVRVEAGLAHYGPEGIGVSPNQFPTLAHEYSHQRWDRDLGANRPEINRQFIPDTEAIARSGNQAAQQGLDNWELDSPAYYAGNDPRWVEEWSRPTETHARIAEVVTDPSELPDWYRRRWYPNVWSEDARGLNAYPRFDMEAPPQMGDPRFMGPDESGRWG